MRRFAADIFHDLHEQVMATAVRGHRVLNRVQHIEEALPSLEKAIQGQTSHIHFAYVAGSDWHANLRTEQSHLLSSDLPRFMLDSYEECRDPPRLYLLDKFDTGGTGSCLKRYSDPSYFKRMWSASVSENAERVPREKKPVRNKRRGSRTRNVEVQHVTPISRRNSSTRFASPSTDSLDFSTEHISMSDVRLKPEYESGTTSSGSKTRLSFVEQSLDTNPSLVPDEAEFDNLSVSNLQINHNDSCSSAPNVDRRGNTAEDDSQRDSLQGSIARSPSVTWDEKTEILKPTSPRSCDNILVDSVLDSEALPETSEPSNVNLQTAEFGASGQEDILLDTPNRRLSTSIGNHFDEITSETDNYMDALNTLESETETDSECQTKREVELLSNFGYLGMESGTENMSGTAAINSDSSDIETPVASHKPLNNDEPPASLESSEQIQSPLEVGTVPNLDISAGNDGSENGSDMSRIECSEGIKDDPSANSRIPNLQTMFFDENTVNTTKSVDSPFDTSSVPSTKLWTNGGLLGLEPSKPPDFSVLNSSSESAVSGSKNTECDSSSYMVTTKLHYGESSGKSEAGVTRNESMSRSSNYLENMDGSPNTLSSVDRSSLNSDQLFGMIYNAVEPNKQSKYSPSYHQQDDISVKQNSGDSAEALSLRQFEKIRDTPESNYAQAARHDQERPSIAPGVELPDSYNIESQPNDSDQNTRSMSSSFSGLAQRFLANSLQRRVSHIPVDISVPSGAVNSDVRSQNIPFQNKHKEGSTEVASQISHRQNIKEKFEQGSFKKSMSSSSRYSENSSPPLEHMKISFHPMNGPDSSKLKLEFPHVNLHESTEDLMFPSFQLVPGPVLPSLDTGSESDDDTFCRSSVYSSEDIHTPRSYSNSELWEQDGRSGSKDHEIYDDSRRISSSTTSSSSFVEFEQLNHCRIDSASGLENFEAKDDTVSLHSGPTIDLPGLGSVICLKNQQQGQCNTLSVDHSNSALQLPNMLPPPPPLPPMQWRLMKPSFASGEDNDSTPMTVEHFDDLQAQRFAVVPQLERTVLRPPCITEAMPVHSNKKIAVHDKKKLDRNRELNRVDGNKVDERDELLHQIRNKAFNLRRIVPAKPSITPQTATNVNVVAILEKANAIRQACVGSDEGGGDDDDNWSDG